MKKCLKCGINKPDWLFMEVEKGNFVCISCATEIVKKHWSAS